MKKVLFVALAALPLVLLSLSRSPVAFMQTSGAIADNAVSFRVVFGEKQERPKDYSGSISLSAGKLLRIKPWRFFGADSLDGDAAWKLQIKAAAFENQPDQVERANRDQFFLCLQPSPPQKALHRKAGNQHKVITGQQVLPMRDEEHRKDEQGEN